MGIIKNNKNIIAIYRGDKKVTSVFKNNNKIFGVSEPPIYSYKDVTLQTYNDNEKINDFSNTFYNCYNWYGQCPIDKNGEKLFVRSDGSNGYVIPNYTQNCFSACGSSDMSIIPTSWGGNKSEVLICIFNNYSGNIEITKHIEYFKLVKYTSEYADRVIYDASNGEQSGAFSTDITDSGKIEFYIKDDINNITEAFAYNNNLISVEGKINSNINIVSGLFKECTSLTNIPSKLFANCKNITDFSSTFYNCYSIIDNSPIDNDGTSIYNRSYGKEGYETPYYISGCFYNCINMADYSVLPSEWL